MNKPLQVYLDSSDFSVLSDQRRRTAEVISVERALLSWQDKGLIELRFSQIHLIEAAPTAPEYLSSAINRFTYIKKICRRKCLISYVTILEEEVRGLNPLLRLGWSNRLNDEAKWFPEFDLANGLADYMTLHHECIEELPNRESRRAAKRKTMKKGGLSEGALKIINESAANTVKEIANKYPFTPGTARICLEYIKGNASKETFSEALSESLKDLQCLGEWYEKQWDRAIPMSAFMRVIGESVRSSTIQAANEFTAITKKYQSLGFSERELDNESRKLFDGLLISIPNNLTLKIARALDMEIQTDGISWENLPSLLTAINISVHMARKTALANKSIRNPKVSDMGDFMHAFYLPHVDIFRTDADISSTISEAKLPFKTTVVGNLLRLPEVIESRL